VTPKQQNILRVFLGSLVGMALIFELIRDSQRDGDFIGYINAGNAVLNGSPIYADYLNTWPPFFAIFSVPLAWIDAISPLFIRLVWLIGIIISWFYISRYVVRLTSKNKVVLFKSDMPTDVWLLDWRVFLPLLFILRFILDDLSNIQINTFLLLACLFVIDCHFKRRHIAGGIVLGLIIALKVYPLFLLLFLFYKRSWKMAVTTIIVLAGSVGMSLLVFGWDVGIANYVDWISNKVMGATIITHKNQSLFPWFEGLLTDQSRGLDIFYNISSLSSATAKKVPYVVVGVVALFVGWRFRNSDTREQSVGQFFFILAAIPILSPLAWKYYFVFLFPILFLQFNRLFIIDAKQGLSKGLFIAALVLSIASTDGLLGTRVSDVLEIYGCVTWATACLLLSYIVTDKPLSKL
jgi:hypothetical protein